MCCIEIDGSEQNILTGISHLTNTQTGNALVIFTIIRDLDPLLWEIISDLIVCRSIRQPSKTYTGCLRPSVNKYPHHIRQAVKGLMIFQCNNNRPIKMWNL